LYTTQGTADICKTSLGGAKNTGILSCMISERDHPLAFLRATPELTVLEGRNVKDSSYHGVLNVPAKLSL
jgi:hypothetical protein